MKAKRRFPSTIIMALGAIIIYSWFQFPALESNSQSNKHVFQLADKIDNTNEAPLRSIIEGIVEIEETSTTTDHLSVEYVYASIVKIQFIQKQIEISDHGSSTKRYLRLLQLLI
jgi:hypothetical protein